MTLKKNYLEDEELIYEKVPFLGFGRSDIRELFREVKDAWSEVNNGEDMPVDIRTFDEVLEDTLCKRCKD